MLNSTFQVVCLRQSCWSYVAPFSVLSVYYGKICIKFASHHLLYVVYMCQKSLNFYLCIQMLPAKCKWLHFSWATLYRCIVMPRHHREEALSVDICRVCLSVCLSVCRPRTWPQVENGRAYIASWKFARRQLRMARMIRDPIYRSKGQGQAQGREW